MPKTNKLFHRIVMWDHRDEADVAGINAAIAHVWNEGQLAGAKPTCPHMQYVETGADHYALVVTNYKIDADQAQKLYDDELVHGDLIEQIGGESEAA